MKSRGIFGGIIAIVIVASSLFVAPTARATPLAPDWNNGDVTVKKSERAYSKDKCVNERRRIKTYVAAYYKQEDYQSKEWCIYHYKGFDITFYKRWSSNVALDASDVFVLYPREESGMAISFDGGDMLPVFDVSYFLSYHLAFTRGMDRVWYTGSCEWRGCELRMYDFSEENFTKSLTNDYFTYSWKENKLRYDGGQVVMGEGYSISENGEWASFIIWNVGLIRMHVPTLTIKLVQVNYSYSPPTYISTQAPSIAIDNNGQNILISGPAIENAVVTYTTGCESDTQLEPYDNSRIIKRPICQYRPIIHDLLMSIPLSGSGALNISNLMISGLGDHAWVWDVTTASWYDLFPANSQESSLMDYLALGDSFSSGEGDIDATGSIHYLSGTNVLGNYKDGIPRELCHISDRSYPFLLAKDMQIGRGNNMQSIACSAAVRNDVYSLNSDQYLGQPVPRFDFNHNAYSLPRLQGLNNVAELQDQAMANFVPGRVRQIELLKKYKPKVATIGISGNDVGFGPVLMECTTKIGGDCRYATEDGRAELGAIIRSNYQKQVDLYKALKAASPGTDLYAVGYPQFISDSNVFCWSTAGSLSAAERHMMTEAVTYLNETVKRAASTAGIKYVNIENSLNQYSGDMCEGSGMVTSPAGKVFASSITGMLRDYEDSSTTTAEAPIQDYILSSARKAYRASNEGFYMSPITAITLYMQETFHPNAIGHLMEYSYIHTHQKGNSLLDAVCDGAVIVCPSSETRGEPDVSSYFGGNIDYAERKNMIDTGTSAYTGDLSIVHRGTKLDAVFSGTRFGDGSEVVFHIYSQPRLIGGTVYSGNQLRTSLHIPDDMPVGFHDIVASGMDSFGKDIRYIQTIFVTGLEGDIDGDGVPDKVDSCAFLAPSGVDLDKDGIDDSCDAAIIPEGDITLGSTMRAYSLEGETNKVEGYGSASSASSYDYRMNQGSVLSSMAQGLKKEPGGIDNTYGYISAYDNAAIILTILLICSSIAYAKVRVRSNKNISSD